MPDSIKNNLIKIQKKIQELKSDSGNSGILQYYLHQASQLIEISDKEAGTKIKKCSDELNFYSRSGEDNLKIFYNCKAESLSIIAKHISA